MTAPLYAEIDLNRLPRHVAIIMDGNGRWAKQHKVKVALGHRTGTETLREIIRSSSDIGIEALSLYAFSTENWARPAAEVEALMQLILDFFASEIDELDEKNVRITILGDKDALPPRQRDVLREAERRTLENTGLRLNIAINYGARAELARAARQIAQEVQSGTLNPSQVDEKVFSDRLYTQGSAGRRFAHPHQRRDAPEQFPALSVRLCRVSLPHGAVAGFHRRGLSPLHRAVPGKKAPLWQTRGMNVSKEEP